MRSYNKKLFVVFLIGFGFWTGASWAWAEDVHPLDDSDDLPALQEPHKKLNTEGEYPPSSTLSNVDTTSPPPRSFRQPSFHSQHPHWGIEFATSLQALGGKALTFDQGSSPIYGVSIQGDYQPSFVGRWGVLGIGPSLAIYPAGGSGFTDTLISILGVGGQIRYQARFFRNQPIVPVVGYAVEYIRYQFQPGVTFANGQMSAGEVSGVFTNGPVLGLWLFLNILEPSSAADSFIDSGVLRSYLIFESRFLQGSSKQLTLSGQSYYFGFRIEL